MKVLLSFESCFLKQRVHKPKPLFGGAVSIEVIRIFAGIRNGDHIFKHYVAVERINTC
jgi:hypothetical protein